MSARPWSLARRLKRWFALTTAFLVLSISGVSALFLHESYERELSALVLEELDEMSALLVTTEGRPEDFERIAGELAREHPANPLAWRVWESGTGELWGEFGVRDLLSDEVPARAQEGVTIKLPDSLRARTERSRGGDLTIGLVLDGSVQLAQLRRFGLLALFLTFIASILAFLGGSVFCRRMSNLLRRVADGARQIHTPAAEMRVDDEGAPEEIRDVVDALREMLGNIRGESERARLLTTGMAHELGSPIQNLVGETEVALMSERSNGEYREVLRSHLEELRDLSNAVGNLVTLCSLGESHASAEQETFDLALEADLRLRREHGYAARRGVELEVNSTGDLEVVGDREALLLALSNLVGNAIDWTPPGGAVKVELTGHAERVEILVDDGGPGVEPEARERIFEPFYRGASANGRRLGYGLGLSITRTAVAAHSGRIEIGDSPSGGARFRVLLPRAGLRRPRSLSANGSGGS